jgi:hypothetical protein
VLYGHRLSLSTVECAERILQIHRGNGNGVTQPCLFVYFLYFFVSCGLPFKAYIHAIYVLHVY